MNWIDLGYESYEEFLDDWIDKLTKLIKNLGKQDPVSSGGEKTGESDGNTVADKPNSP